MFIAHSKQRAVCVCGCGGAGGGKKGRRHRGNGSSLVSFSTAPGSRELLLEVINNGAPIAYCRLGYS